MATEQIEAAIAAAGSGATKAGAGTTVVAWYFSNEFLGVMGLLIALAGMVVNAYYKRKADRRHEAEHQERMRQMRGEDE
ncbi:hypothetical protein M8A51_23590 [Schlegelella sp. S2-27]|uniref:Holin n=1 Tax=Caldimonas mangrovi TaxID=2944811 RepID=A0ABT0YUU6_9BURK|nr:holin [Caldimonas mangrovi]MCM5682524.1 hypothetical protein [Caldimonas mangrovi]